MKLITVDNFLDISYLNKFNDYCLKEIPHNWGQYAIDPSKSFYYHHFEKDNEFINKIYLNVTNNIFKKILTKKPLHLRSYINIQHEGMDSELHSDEGDITVLLMVTPTPKKGGGEFQYINKQGNIQNIPYKQNRLIVFESKTKHKGLAYKERNPRITLAFKNIIKK
tara:strand:+ start:472 stop:969 length:498 start_codon:yes stop_codon:yes gene_type:complete